MTLAAASDLVSPASDLVSPNSDLVVQRPDVAAGPPPATTDLPAGLPSGFFSVAALTGEVSRVWIVTGAESNGYVFGVAPRPVVGAHYTNSFVFVGEGLPLSAIRLPANTLRLHHGGSASFRDWLEARDGDSVDEPDLSIYVYTAADTSAEFRLSQRGPDGGSYVNWDASSGVWAAARTALLTEGAQAILILADAAA